MRPITPAAIIAPNHTLWGNNHFANPIVAKKANRIQTDAIFCFSNFIYFPLLGEGYALLLGPQPLGYFKFCLELAHALAPHSIKPEEGKKKDQGGYHDVGFKAGHQKPQDNDCYNDYCEKTRCTNVIFTVRLAAERFPLIELGLINAREIGRCKFLDVHIIGFKILG
jgi:hypothetical protein